MLVDFRLIYIVSGAMEAAVKVKPAKGHLYALVKAREVLMSPMCMHLHHLTAYAAVQHSGTTAATGGFSRVQ